MVVVRSLGFIWFEERKEINKKGRVQVKFSWFYFVFFFPLFDCESFDFKRNDGKGGGRQLKEAPPNRLNVMAIRDREEKRRRTTRALCQPVGSSSIKVIKVTRPTDNWSGGGCDCRDRHSREREKEREKGWNKYEIRGICCYLYQSTGCNANLETRRIKKTKQKKNSTGGGCVRWFKRHEKKEENQVIASNAETLSKRSDLFIIVASVKNKKEKKLCLP